MSLKTTKQKSAINLALYSLEVMSYRIHDTNGKDWSSVEVGTLYDCFNVAVFGSKFYASVTFYIHDILSNMKVDSRHDEEDISTLDEMKEIWNADSRLLISHGKV